MLLAMWHHAAPLMLEIMNVERYRRCRFHCLLFGVEMEKCEIGGVKAMDGVSCAIPSTCVFVCGLP